MQDESPDLTPDPAHSLETVAISVGAENAKSEGSWQSAFHYLRKNGLQLEVAEEAAAEHIPAVRRPSIVVLSGITANNLGDDATLISVVRDIQRLRPNAEITVLAEDPGRCGPVLEQINVPIEKSLQLYVRGLLGILKPGEKPSATLCKIAQQLFAMRGAIEAGRRILGVPEDLLPGLRRLMTADGVIDCGGANLTPRWKSYFYEKCLDYLLAPEPLFISGQGIDPLDDPDDVELLLHALSRASEITVREKVSERYLERIGCKSPFSTTGDDALTLQASSAERADMLMNAAGLTGSTPFVAAHFRYWDFFGYDEDQFATLLARYADQVIESTGLPVLAVPMHFGTADERGFLLEVRERVSQTGRFHVVESHITPGDAKALFAGARLALGISYHGAIFSLSSGVPYLGLYAEAHYSQKMHGLSELYGFPQLPISLRSTTPKEFGRVLKYVLENREGISERLNQKHHGLLTKVLGSRERFIRRLQNAPSVASVTSTITADPNPIQVAGHATSGVTTLSWSSEDAEALEVHVDASDGPLLSRTGPTGSAATGEWVRDGTVFCLQDVSGGKSLTTDNTLASVTVRVRPQDRRPDPFAADGLILMYHRVAQVEQDPWSLCVTPQHFAEHLEVLGRFGRPTRLAQMTKAVREGTLPQRSIVLTFDDGYADNFLAAKPLLERYSIPATMFVVSGSVGERTEFWWDELEQLSLQGGTFSLELYRSLYKLLLELPTDERRATLDKLWAWQQDQPQLRPTHRTLSADELATLGASELIDIGGHTDTHPVLPALPEDRQRAEIVSGKLRLQEMLGRPVRQFAYPHGRFSRTTMELVEAAGFECACAAAGGPLDHSAGLYQLPRVAVEDWDGDEFAMHLSTWLGPNTRRSVRGGVAPEFTISDARLELKSAERNAEEMDVRLQSAEQTRQSTAIGFRAFQEHFDSALHTCRGQRAWQLMLATQKAYTLLVRNRDLGGFLGWMIRFPWEKGGALAPFEPAFPRLESYIPVALDSPFAGVSPNGAARTLQTIPRQTKCDLIILPVFEFEFRFQRPQQLAIHFAQLGHRVFWISPSRLPPDDTEKPWRATALRENLWEVRLRAPRPNIYLGELQPAETGGLVDALGSLYRDWAIAESAAMIQLPFWRSVGLGLRERFGAKVVFDCMDDWESMPDISPFNRAEEVRLVGECDLLVLTAQQLMEKYGARARRSVLARNAVDYEFFANAHSPDGTLASIRRPIVGYFGAIASWFDYELLYQVIASRPQYSFVLIGGLGLEQEVAGSEIAKFRKFPNVSLLGHKDYREIPGYLEQFDACIIPFVMNTVISATDPVKFYEYLSRGKPVVATRMPELADRSDLLYLAADAADFAAKLDSAVSENDDELTRRRISYAASNTWRQRVETISAELKETFEPVSILVVTHNSREYVGPCLDSIARNTSYPNYEVIVVDNGSADDTVELVEARAASDDCLRVIRLDENRGFAHANNVAAREARGSQLILLNIDTVVTPGWVERLLRHVRRDPSIGIVVPVTNWAGNEARINVSYAHERGMEDFALALATENAGLSLDLGVAPLFCALVPRRIWEEADGLDERFEVGMFEDDDFSVSVRALKYRIVTAEDCFIHHFGRGSFAQLDPARYQQIFEQNKRHFEQKWGTKWLPHRHRPGVHADYIPFDPVKFGVGG